MPHLHAAHADRVRPLLDSSHVLALSFWRAMPAALSLPTIGRDATMP
ncbi:hypothetical protein [Clavibacter michiganensis]|uniref:Uncharacterized protein n=1 Tax=Clavibacter michiganensis subsp. michiganensis TaxID=33013 RepID=A0A1Y3FDB5_CLAMM|nr:hypothetical protein [Clavibacter michiganensis]KAF0257409.1 hypothetical protein DOU02_13565 [Clavibacter michiganensis subsp. michiganensis]MBF4639289.1 hypothetical protein [Clavibacter michiganensis subsp. michiganensis]MDO4018356.1 hypothetical protein [Clavibacter michiganensis]MDO4031878.1 hypothetical protein [Clavibacter michiganensis]MDO4038061.1 hypothetical protein [Clavibacter michiganensis]